jgi:thiol-disulfide isomerase/thioredoxin
MKLIKFIFIFFISNTIMYDIFCQDRVFFITPSFKNIKSVGVSFNDETGSKYSQLFTDSLSANILSLKSNKIILFYSIDKNSIFHKQYMYVEPTDSIQIDFIRNHIILTSNYSDEISFWNEMSIKGYNYNNLRESNDLLPNYSPRMQFDTIESYFNNRQRISQNLFKTSSKYRNNFKKSIGRLNLLIRDFCLLAVLDQENNTESINNIINDPFLYQEFLDIKKHLAISKADILIYPSFFCDVLYNYCRFMSFKSLGTVNEFEDIFNTIFNNFDGDIRDIALTIHMKEGLKTGVSSPFLERYKNICTNINYVLQTEKEIIKLSEVNKSIMNETLKDRDGNTLSWANFIGSHLGKTIYIDFWASWCGGCKYLIPQTINLKSEFKQIYFVYFSIENSETKWNESIESWGIGNFEHYYLSPESRLIKLFATPSIPRFTLISKKGEILTTDAPHPNNPTIYKYFEEIFKK